MKTIHTPLSKSILRSAPTLRQPILYTLYFILTILTTLPLQGAGGPTLTPHPTKKFSSSPINLAVILVEHTDSAKIASILDYYGYKPVEEQGGSQSSPFRGSGGFSGFQDTYGNEISYTFTDGGVRSAYPTIHVKHSESAKSLDTRLKDMKFEKTGRGYQRKMNHYSKYTTTCTPSPHNTLLFRRQQAPRPPKGGEE